MEIKKLKNSYKIGETEILMKKNSILEMILLLKILILILQ